MYTGARLAGYSEERLEERRLSLLGWAVLVSLVLHACILLFLSYLRQGSPVRAAPPPLTARLVKPKPPEPVPPLVEPRVQPPLRPRPASPAQQLQPKPQPAPARTPAAPTPVLSVEPAKQSADPVFTVPAAPSQPAPRADAQPTLAPESGADPEAIKRFGIELREIAKRYKRYPRVAQDNNWEGHVELRIVYAANGLIASLTVKKSAGRQVFDEEAQAMIRSAQAQVAIPPALRGKAFALEIPVDFIILKGDTR